MMDKKENTLNPYDLMPELKKFHVLSRIIDRVENRSDSKALAGWAAVLSGAIVFIFTALSTIYEAANDLKLSTSLVDLYNSNSNFVYFLFGCLISFAFVVIVRLILIRRENKELLELDTASGFKMIQVVCMAHIRSKDKVDFVYRYWMQARKDGVRFFDMNFGWTSHSDTLKIEIRNKKFSFNISEDRKYFRKKFIIDLGAPLKKGHREILEFSFQTDTTGQTPGDPCISLASASPKYPRFNTFLCVIAEPSVEIANLYREEYVLYLVDEAIRKDAVKLNKERKHIWPIPIKRGWQNRLVWTFGD